MTLSELGEACGLVARLERRAKLGLRESECIEIALRLQDLGIEIDFYVLGPQCPGGGQSQGAGRVA